MVFNPDFYLGFDLSKELIDEINACGYERIFIATDRNLLGNKILDYILDALNEIKAEYLIFDEINPNPTVENVQKGVDRIKESNSDFILAIGGGSVIDTAKAISIISKNEGNYDVTSLEGVNKAKRRGTDLFVFPTTAGTGSETTMDFVITNVDDKRKMACMDKKAVPKVAFLDVKMMEGLPPKMTAATGMDALTHAIESYTSQGANILSEFYSLKSIELIASNITRCTRDGSDIEARKNMALGSYLAGVSFTNVGLGIVHSLAHPLSAHYNIPHGIANALMLPYAMDFNIDASINKYSDVAQALGVDKGNMCKLDHARKGVEIIREMIDELNLPSKLQEVGVERERIEVLSQSAFEDVSTLDNPKKVNSTDLKEIYLKAFL